MCILTLDVEDHNLGDSNQPSRFREALEPLLALMAERDIKATFFVVGNLAHHWATELRELAGLGHEIGLHGYTHRHLRDLGADAFREEAHRGASEIASIVGIAPAGFRAPYFSLTRYTPWAPSILADEGFRYSSSVLPAWNPQAGFAAAPKSPFIWEGSELIEFPAPVFGLGPAALPILGGAYVRLVPAMLVRAAARRVRSQRGAWTYVHPYDLDVDEPYHKLPNQSAVVARLLFARRNLMLQRIDSLCSATAGLLKDLTFDATFVKSLPHFKTTGQQTAC